MKLSPWHSCEEEPVHIGVYQTQIEEGDTHDCFSFWDGVIWHGQWDSIQHAYSRLYFLGYATPVTEWRGIVK